MEPKLARATNRLLTLSCRSTNQPWGLTAPQRSACSTQTLPQAKPAFALITRVTDNRSQAHRSDMARCQTPPSGSAHARPPFFSVDRCHERDLQIRFAENSWALIKLVALQIRRRFARTALVRHFSNRYPGPPRADLVSCVHRCSAPGGSFVIACPISAVDADNLAGCFAIEVKCSLR